MSYTSIRFHHHETFNYTSILLRHKMPFQQLCNEISVEWRHLKNLFSKVLECLSMSSTGSFKIVYICQILNNIKRCSLAMRKFSFACLYNGNVGNSSKASSISPSPMRTRSAQSRGDSSAAINSQGSANPSCFIYLPLNLREKLSSCTSRKEFIYCIAVLFCKYISRIARRVFCKAFIGTLYNKFSVFSAAPLQFPPPQCRAEKRAPYELSQGHLCSS